jgi:hypothetical protein
VPCIRSSPSINRFNKLQFKSCLGDYFTGFSMVKLAF